MSFATGSKLGRYTIQALLGQGGLAVVYRAIRDQDGTVHALKVLRLSTDALRRRLLREGQLQSALAHPNIVPVTDTIETFSACGLVMPLIEGPTLEALLGQHVLTLPQLDHLARGILSGVAHAHAHDVVHRDLKPANVLVDIRGPQPTPRVADFGLARLLGDGEQLTRTGLAMGTPGYMAPEQIRSARRAGKAADVFSLGAILYTMVAGRPPFLSTEMGALLQAAESEAFPPLDEARLGARAPLIHRALSAEPTARFADASALLAAWPASSPANWPSLEQAQSSAGSSGSETVVSTMSLDSTPDAWEEGRFLVGLGRLAAGEEPLVRAHLAAWNGQEVGTAAGLSAMFLRAEDAVGFAVACCPPGGGQGAVVHGGRVVLQQPSQEAIARGARSLELSGAPVVLLEALTGLSVAGQIVSTLPGEGLSELGHWRLPASQEPVRLYGRAEGALPEDSASAWRVVRDGERWRPLREVPHNLPRLPGAFVGRAAELAALSEAGPVAVMLGTGGVGKTRLAVRWAHQQLGRFPGGAWFCDLSSARSSEEMLDALARILRPTSDADDLSERLLHALQGRRRCLVILDNVEQIADEVAELLAAWSRRVPEVAFLLTSRIRIHGAESVPLMPMPVKTDAMQLFLDRVRQARPGHRVNPAEQAAAEEICALLGGLPLALELAAVRVRVMPLTKIRARLSDRFRLLRSRTAVTQRQSTLQATISWSWEMLSGWEKAALAQCSAFSGPFDLEDAEGVLELEDFEDALWPMDAVQGLVDQSLLRSTLGPGDEGPRFQMYPSVQVYAAQQLKAPGAFPGSGPQAEADAWRRHGQHFAALGEPDALEALDGPDGAEQHRRIRAALDNLLAATQRANARQDAVTAAPCGLAAGRALLRSGSAIRAAELLESVAALDNLADAQRAALWCAAGLAWLEFRRYRALDALLQQRRVALLGGQQEGMYHYLSGEQAARTGHLEEGRTAYQAALRIGSARQDKRLMILAWQGLGWVANSLGEPDAPEHYEAALQLAVSLGDLQKEAVTLRYLGQIDQLQGRMAPAEERCRRAMMLSREVGDARTESMASSQLSFLCRQRGDLSQAEEHIHHALTLAREHGDRSREGIFASSYGAVLGDMGRNSEAVTLLEEARAVLTELDNVTPLTRTLSMLAGRYALMDDMDRALQIYEEVEELLQHGGNRWLEAQLRANVARIKRRQGKLAEAEQSYSAALSLAQELGFRRHEGVILNNLGNLLLDLGKVAEARRCFTESLALQQAIGARRLEALPLSGLATAAELEGDLDEATAQYTAALRIGEEVDNRLYVGWLRSNMGWLAQRRGQLLVARGHYKAAEALLEQSRAPGYAALLLSRQALLNAQHGQHEQALEKMRRATGMLGGITVPAEQVEILCNQVALWAQLGRDPGIPLLSAKELFTQIGFSKNSPLGSRLAQLDNLQTG